LQDHDNNTTADVDPDVIDADPDLDADTNPAMHVLPAVERVSVAVCPTIPDSN